MIVSCRFLKFLHYLCFWGQGILCWHSYWATMFGDLNNSGHLPIQEVFEVTQIFVPWRKCFKFISSRAKVAGRSHDQRFIVNFIVMSCHVMSRHVTSCHVMPRHVTSCHIKSRHVTSIHVMSPHVTSCHAISRHVTSCHVMPRYATSCHVISRHITSHHVMSCHVMSHRKSRDGHTTNALLSTDFFHAQLIQIRHNRVCWLSRRVPIPYRISGILSSLNTGNQIYMTKSRLNCAYYIADMIWFSKIGGCLWIAGSTSSKYHFLH